MANKKGSNGIPSKFSQQQLDVCTQVEFFSFMKKKKKLNLLSLQDSRDYSSLKTVLFYCSLIVFLPVATFFLLQSVVLDNLFTLTPIKSNIYSAVGAVVVLHLALGLYIFRAYFGLTTGAHGKDD